MRILMATAEYEPLAKVGGLGDAVASLARALARRGHDVRVVMPCYDDVDRAARGVAPRADAASVRATVDGVEREVRLQSWRDPAGPEVVLLEEPGLFGRAGVYGYGGTAEFGDTAQRLHLHGACVLLAAEAMGWRPDLLHVHDAASALVLAGRRHWPWAEAWRDLPGVLTIHNQAHQSSHPPEAARVFGLPEHLARFPGPLEFWGRLNLLKAGILYADRVTTVSPTYAREVVDDSILGCGLDGVLASRGDDFSGILNGVDTDVWNPAADPHLPAVFDVDDLGGKAVCRDRLLDELGLEPVVGPRAAAPVLGVVGRLVEQKGYDLLPPLIDGLADAGWRLAVLGTGEEGLAATLREAVARRPGRAVFVERFDEGLAHRIIAGSDLFLMPSRFEPCGLTQMFAMRYGTLPVVHRTGGLADTVVDADEPDGTGFVFRPWALDALRGTLIRAGDYWRESIEWGRIQRRGMVRDFSWDGPASEYEALYGGLMP